MQEQSWAEGYVVDIGYTHGFYRELTPSLLRFVTLLGETEALDLEQPFTYYELGCGNGHSTALLAAANPHGRFFGVDFNPTHIHHARGLAADAGIKNVEFLEKSFAELRDADLPDAEVIALHGVYSWVSAENRGHIVDFIRRRLKPAGIVYVSYNCLPGQAQIAPLQRLLHDMGGSTGGPAAQRVGRAVDFARRLEQAGADFFRVNPVAGQRLGRLGGEDPSYVAHEYLNAEWMPFYHADVAADMSGAKLNYAGSAALLENFPQFVVKPPIVKLIGEAGDRTAAETLKDFARNTMFRRDVFTRGAPRAAAPALEAMLGLTRFALACPRSVCRLTEATPVGQITLHAEAYAPVLEALAREPMTFDDMQGAAETRGMNRQQLRQALFGMAAFGNVLPALPAAGELQRRDATGRFNAAILSRPATGKTTMLASPVLGTGIPLNFFDVEFLRGPRERAAAIDSVLDALQRSGRKLQMDDKPVESPEDLRRAITERATFFFDDLLPFLRLIGVAD